MKDELGTMWLTWKPEKNEWLKSERNLSFEEVENAIANGGLVDVLQNARYRNQVILVVEMEEYMIAVPALVKSRWLFLMTAYPSRALTQKYRGKK